MFVLVLLHFVTAVTINLCQYCKNNVIRILLSLLSDSASRMMASLVSPVKQVYLVADRRPLCPIHCAEQLLLLFIYYTRRQHISNRLQIQKKRDTLHTLIAPKQQKIQSGKSGSHREGVVVPTLSFVR